MSEIKKVNDFESTEVSGGYGGYSPSDWEKIRIEAEKRGTCLNCGKNFSDATHTKKFLPSIMNAEYQKFCEINWCCDCIEDYWERYGKGWESFLSGKK